MQAPEDHRSKTAGHAVIARPRESGPGLGFYPPGPRLSTPLAAGRRRPHAVQLR
jgi:hypothetical protein